MKASKLYTAITSIELADNDNVYCVTQERLDDRFLGDLKGYYEGGLAEACEDYGVALTKEECLQISEDARVVGWGIYSGSKLWQLPARLRNQVSKAIGKTVIEH